MTDYTELLSRLDLARTSRSTRALDVDLYTDAAAAIRSLQARATNLRTTCEDRGVALERAEARVAELERLIRFRCEGWLCVNHKPYKRHAPECLVEEAGITPAADSAVPSPSCPRDEGSGPSTRPGTSATPRA